MKATLLSTRPLQKPRSLNNPDLAVVASETAWLSAAEIKHPLDLTLKGDRAIARRMAERVVALCDYWEGQQA